MISDIVSPSFLNNLGCVYFWTWCFKWFVSNFSL